MSILPAEAHRSTSSSSPEASSSNPSSPHGLLQSSSFSQSPPSSASHQIPAFGSLRISDSESSLNVSDQISGASASTSAGYGKSPEKVIETGRPNGQRNHTSKQSPNSAGRGFGAANSRGDWTPSSIPRQQGQEISRPSNRNGSVTAQSSGRKSQVTSGNHLLNFRYDRISRPQTRAPPPPRRQHKIKPYNKDLFLQANYRFVLLDSGNHSHELMDPDKMFQWEDIISLRYSTPHPVHCPICLEYPLCPQITSCGHIYCFPCILRYFLMGQEDFKGESWKKCPLCFMMICSKDLYTIYIDHVKSYGVGDIIEFMLLTRQRDSNIISQKNNKETETKQLSDNEFFDAFSKFTFTSDVDSSVRKTLSDLDSWLAKADSGLVDDIEKLPYVAAALEQLEKRKKNWNERRSDSCNKANKKIDSSKEPAKHANKSGVAFGSLPGVGNKNNPQNNFIAKNSSEGASMLQIVDDDLYCFYQAIDGQNFILHPLNMKCLLHHYGSYDSLPQRISGKILQLETVIQSEAIRRRYRYLSHFSLTTAFQICEIDLSGKLPPDSLSPFMDEISKREKQRKRLAKKEQVEKIKAEAAISQSLYVPFILDSHQESAEFSMDDFQALGNPVVTSSSPPAFGERKLFSNVARLGFAAAHDSPALNMEGARDLRAAGLAGSSSSSNNEVASDSSFSAAGSAMPGGVQSFASITSREKSVEPRKNETGKKAKKTTRVLMSTAGGRRY